MSTILVTGGSGFIGREVIRQLHQAKYNTVNFSLPQWDVCDGASVERAMQGCWGVIHLAGVLGTHELFDTPELAIDVNIKGTLNVLDAARMHDAVYVGITMPPVFPSIYTATKVAAARLASAYHHTYGLPVSHVRAFNAFGPGQAHGPGHPQKIVPTFATRAWRREPIPVWGNGTQTVDLIHTRDLAHMLVDALNHGDDDVFDGGTGQSFTVHQVAMMILRHTGLGGRIEKLPMRKGEIPTEIVAGGEGWRKLGWRPEFRKEDLYETVDWYKDR